MQLGKKIAIGGGIVLLAIVTWKLIPAEDPAPVETAENTGADEADLAIADGSAGSDPAAATPVEAPVADPPANADPGPRSFSPALVGGEEAAAPGPGTPGETAAANDRVIRLSRSATFRQAIRTTDTRLPSVLRQSNAIWHTAITWGPAMPRTTRSRSTATVTG